MKRKNYDKSKERLMTRKREEKIENRKKEK